MDDRRDEEAERDGASTLRNVAVATASTETVGRYGSANAEYVKGYTGVDQQTGQVLHKGLKKIATHTVNPDYADQNLKQQAGFAAEVAATSSKNAQNIIDGNESRVVRTDDMPQEFGNNNTVYDHAVVDADGNVISGTGSQMKFVNDYKSLMNKIAKGKGGGTNDLSRYQGVPLDLPSEQVAAAKQYCDEQAEKLLKQAAKLDELGNTELSAQKRQEAANFLQLKDKIRDSGMTSDQALFYREHPELATAMDIAKTSHGAGIQGAKIGAVVGGAVSLMSNIIAVHRDDKDLTAALVDTAIGTGKAAAVGYGTAFFGSAVKGVMQQSASSTARALSQTSLPTMAVTICLELASAITLYARGEIDGTEFLELIGEKGSGMLAGGMGAMLGQIAIPIPVVGGLIGGMVGYTLSSMLYRDTLLAFKEAKQARQELRRVEAACREAREVMDAQRIHFEKVFSEWLAAGKAELRTCMARMDLAIEQDLMDEFAASANALAACMGKTLQFATRAEFDTFMDGDETLVL